MWTLLPVTFSETILLSLCLCGLGFDRRRTFQMAKKITRPITPRRYPRELKVSTARNSDATSSFIAMLSLLYTRSEWIWIDSRRRFLPSQAFLLLPVRPHVARQTSLCHPSTLTDIACASSKRVSSGDSCPMFHYKSRTLDLTLTRAAREAMPLARPVQCIHPFSTSNS